MTWGTQPKRKRWSVSRTNCRTSGWLSSSDQNTHLNLVEHLWRNPRRWQFTDNLMEPERICREECDKVSKACRNVPKMTGSWKSAVSCTSWNLHGCTLTELLHCSWTMRRKKSVFSLYSCRQFLWCMDEEDTVLAFSHFTETLSGTSQRPCSHTTYSRKLNRANKGTQASVILLTTQL